MVNVNKITGLTQHESAWIVCGAPAARKEREREKMYTLVGVCVCVCAIVTENILHRLCA